MTILGGFRLEANIHDLITHAFHSRIVEKIIMANISYLDNPLTTEELYEKLCQPVRNWFRDKFPDITTPQK